MVKGKLWVLVLVLALVPAVVMASPTIGAKDLINAAMYEFTNQLGGSLENYELIPQGNIPEAITVPQGNIELKAEIPYGIRYNTPTNVNVRIRADGQHFANIGLTFIVKKYENIVIAARDIQPNELLSANCLRIERRDISRLSQGYMTSIAKIEGFVAKRALVPGTVLNNYNIQVPLAVRRGNVITIIVRIGGIEVTAPGEAMQNGVAGQLIRVRNINTQKILLARIMDSTSAQVPTYNERK